MEGLNHNISYMFMSKTNLYLKLTISLFWQLICINGKKAVKKTQAKFKVTHIISFYTRVERRDVLWNRPVRPSVRPQLLVNTIS